MNVVLAAAAFNHGRRHSGARLLARTRNPLGNLRRGTMDSGFSLREPRNDEEGSLLRRHSGADLGAELVDQLETLLGLDVPEGPAVAGLRTLRHRADAM